MKRKVASQRKERKGQRDVVETVSSDGETMEKKRGCVTVAPKAANRRKALAPERFKNPFRRDATDRGLPSVPTVAGVRRDTGAGGWRLWTGVRRRRAIRARLPSRAGCRAVAPRTVLEHLQQREGRDLDVLRGVHLRGIPRGRLGSAPHHTPATHHPGDVHRARFTCAWPVRVRREVDSASETRSDELCEIERNSSRVKSVSTVCVGARNQLSLATEKLTLGRRLGTCVLPRPALSAHCVASGSGTAHDVTTRRPRRARAGHGRRRA